MTRRTALAAIVLALVPDASRAAPPCEPLLVLAAADLQYALGEIADLPLAPGECQPTLIFGSSGTFAAQIEAGAPADVYFAANERYVDALGTKGLLLDGTRTVYAIGRVVLVAASSTAVGVTSLQDLTKPEVRKIAIANPEHAPYGLAAKQALQASGLWDALDPKLVYGENIAQTAQFVRTGNADAGILALSVALGAPDTRYTLVDAGLHAPLVQAAAVLARSKQPDRAKAFLALVRGERGVPIMKKYGFALPEAE